MFSAHNVAIYIINWCLDHNVPITNLKLQKLLYFVQGEYSRAKGTRLIGDDFYAWQLGPVVPNVYAEYSIFSSSTLPSQKQSISFSQEDRCVIDAICRSMLVIPPGALWSCLTSRIRGNISTKSLVTKRLFLLNLLQIILERIRHRKYDRQRENGRIAQFDRCTM